MAQFRALSATNTSFHMYNTVPAGHHPNCVCGTNWNTGSASNTFGSVDFRCLMIHHYPYNRGGCKVCLCTRPAWIFVYSDNHSTFLLSAPGVVTMTFSGVMIKAPFAVAAPLNIFSTMALKVSTTWPSVTYSATPLI